VQRNAPPLSFLDADNKLQGFTPALVVEMGRLGLFEPEVTVDYWQHNLNAFSARRIDVVADVAATEDRRSTMEFSVASATNHAVLFQREDATPLTRSAALRGRTIGVLTGTLSAAYLELHPEIGARVVRYDGQVNLLRAVQNRECDGALFTNLLPADRMAIVEEMKLRKVFVDDIVHTFRFGVRKGDAATLALLNEALATLKHNGTFDRLYDHWVGPVEPREIRLQDLRPYALPAAVLLLAVAGAFVWQRRNVRQIAAHAAEVQRGQQELRRMNSELEWRVAARTNEVEGLLRSIPDVVVIWDRAGTILSCNLPRPELRSAYLRKPIDPALPDPFLAGLASKVTSAMDPEQESIALEHNFAFEGSTRWVEVRGTRIDDRRVLLLIRDVSGRKQMEEDMQGNLRWTRELADMRAQFISIAAHEFGGPLAAATLSTSILELSWNDLSPETRLALLERLKSAHQHLSRMMDDVLALSRADSRGMSPRSSTTDLQRLLQGIINEVKAGTGRNHRFSLECLGGPAVVSVDAKLLQRILSNIVANAVLYSPVDTTVALKLHLLDKAFTITVTDEGIGVPLAERERVFEPFSRGSNVGDRPGAGLGLNIVQRYTEVLGGKVELLPVSRGASFRVTIPRGEPTPPQP
jgi:signal transduction histidine kinase